jgi:hypothetical protein
MGEYLTESMLKACLSASAADPDLGGLTGLRGVFAGVKAITVNQPSAGSDHDGSPPTAAEQKSDQALMKSVLPGPSSLAA